MSRYRHHKYTWTRPFGNARHQWELVGPYGALHFHYSEHKDFSPTAGLEIHRCTPADYQRDEAPSHVDCPLTGGRCWHDGTSLYATETLLPMVQAYRRSGDHEAIFRVLEDEANSRFGHEEDPS